MKRLIFLVLVLFGSGVLAQDRGFRSEGREFYLGMLWPTFINPWTAHTPLPHFQYAVISSYDDNVVTVSFFEKGTNKEVTSTFTIPAGTSKDVLLDKSLMRPDSLGDKPE